VEVAKNAVSDDEGWDNSLGELRGEDFEAEVRKEGRYQLVNPLDTQGELEKERTEEEGEEVL